MHDLDDRVHVLVVDDERRMVELISTYLSRHEIRTTGAYDGPTALQAARRPDVDAVILDLMLPEIDGIEVCRRLREEGNDVPVLMLTARGAVSERVEGLETGADDYLVKPFALQEVHARLRTILRRRNPSADRQITIGEVSLDRDQQRVWVEGREAQLPRREYGVLECLMTNAGRVVTRELLFDTVWNEDVDIRSNVIDVHMSRLRADLGPASGVVITTLRGTGYRLERAPSPATPGPATSS